MIDPLVSLAFSLHSNKGAYALLLGSGISRASGIPTGWEVVVDLIRKVAKLEGEDCEPAPDVWFKKKHGAEPDYSKLIDEIAQTSTERQQLLRGYFESTEEERSEGLKLPSAAHRAIARLVSGGYLRVIITTNFDRLMENALEEVGIVPTVISTTDQLAGALPLAHSGVTVIKLHGDYLDTRIKNTEHELAEYDTKVNMHLDRIFDEYGLIICGWSGDWDIALRSAIERCPSRRFTTYWTTMSSLSAKGRQLAERRHAIEVKIKDANHLFESLLEKVQALCDLAAPHPLSAKMAVATVKRLIVDPSAKIRLHDFVHEETEKLLNEINQAKLVSSRNLQEDLDKYGAMSELLLSVMITGCYWDNEENTQRWVKLLQRIANPNGTGNGLRLYPALLLLYGGGLAALAAGNYKTLASVLTTPNIMDIRNQPQPGCLVLYPMGVIENSIWKTLPELEGHYTPGSDYIYAKLRDPLRTYLPRDEDYNDIFDRFEYILGLVHADMRRLDVVNGWWGPHGCFMWRQFSLEGRFSTKIRPDWPLLKAGLFAGSCQQALTAKVHYDGFLNSIKNNFI
ncbi:MAG: SIR2 family protein [Verrucomicrobiota bacterium]|nr:SIR2 family protein [Verrucomicrobiota bacterium]